MLSQDITALLSIDYNGLFEDRDQCFALLAAKRDSGDADTPPELTEGPIFDLSPGLFLWVTQKHLDNKSVHLVSRDVMSNISVAGLSGSYGPIVDMLADAGHVERAAQIRRADVASHMDVFREFLRAKRAVERYEGLPEAKRKTPGPDRFQRGMAADYATKKQLALDAVDAFEGWSSRYRVAERHREQVSVWKEELRDEAKPKLPAPDKTPMSDKLFWEIIAEAQSGSVSETLLRIEDRLGAYTAKSIKDAAKLLQSLLVDAYREEIWALAYLVQGGCSEDAFEDFRSWMVLQGQAAFGGILASPDTFEPHLADGADFGAAAGLMSAFENAYLTRSGKPLVLPRPKWRRFNPVEDRFAELLPTVSASLKKA
ncbi:MAG: DUF4240 domain-containing protein [Pseudomonadota bacterium]